MTASQFAVLELYKNQSDIIVIKTNSILKIAFNFKMINDLISAKFRSENLIVPSDIYIYIYIIYILYITN